MSRVVLYLIKRKMTQINNSHEYHKDSLLYYSLGLPMDKEYDEESLLKSVNQFIDRAAVLLKDYANSINTDKFVLGLSGGLDSAFVALVAKRALELMNKDSKNLILVTLPCFGTGARTTRNAYSLIDDIKASHKDINIATATRIAIDNMGIDQEDRSVAFENIQARIRTAYLLTLANYHKALQLGTGDASEIALGWCTYGADNISGYNINATVPKTLIKKALYLKGKYEYKEYLYDISITPISPELLPSKSGEEMEQRTEDYIGSYELIDFLIYAIFVKNHSFEEARELLKQNLSYLNDKDPNYIDKYSEIFKKRFNANGFKRLSCPFANLTNILFNSREVI